MKKAIKWCGLALASPLVLFLILSVLLYLPPIQDFAVRKTTEYLSESTETEIKVKKLRLSFPLDIDLREFQMIDQHHDTLMAVRSLIVDLKLSQLLRGKVDVEGIRLRQAQVDTKEMITGVSIKGHLGNFFINSHGIDLKKEHVIVNRAELADAQVAILLNDSTETDTTTSAPLHWIIDVRKATIKNSNLMLSMPGDTMHIHTSLEKVQLKQGNINLNKNIYTAQTLDLSAPAVRYDITNQPAVEGLDVNHIQASNISLGTDSIWFDANQIACNFHLRHLMLQEKSGLEVSRMSARVQLDSTQIKIPDLLLETPDSRLTSHVDMDWKSVSTPDQGHFQIRLAGYVGKQDLFMALQNMPQDFIRQYPKAPLKVLVSADGNMQRIKLNELKLDLPRALQLKAKGNIFSVTDTEKLKAQIQLEAQTDDLDFIKELAEPRSLTDIAFPHMKLQGAIKVDRKLYQADLKLQEANGTIAFNGSLDADKMRYQGNLSVNQMNIHHFLPQDSIYQLSAHAQIKGTGTDVFSSRTQMQASLKLDTLEYGRLKAGGLTLTADLNQNKGTVNLKSTMPLLQTNTTLDVLLNRKQIEAELKGFFQNIDLHKLKLTPQEICTSMNLNVKLKSNLKNDHRINATVSDFSISTSDSSYKTKDVWFQALAQPDTTYAYLASGDLLVNVSARENYMKIIEKANCFMEALNRQIKQRYIDQDSLKTLLPMVRLHIKSGRNNPIINYLATSGYQFKNMDFDIHSDPQIGLNGGGYVYRLNTGGILIDTIQTHIFQDSSGVKMNARVCNGPKNKQIIFESLIEAYIHSNGAGLHLTYLDEKRKKGVDIGFNTHVVDSGLYLYMYPKEPILAYRHFTLNPDNYVYMGKNQKLFADVRLEADDKSTIKIFSKPQGNLLQDLVLSLKHINLDELTSVIPYAPQISGMLQGDIKMKRSEEHLSVSSNLDVENMAYEKAPLGRIGAKLFYLPNDNGTHAVKAQVLQNENIVMNMLGEYESYEKGDRLDGNIQLIRFPMALANGFISGQLATLHGYANGDITLNGSTDSPHINGKIELDSLQLRSQEYSVALRMENDSILIQDNQINLDKMRFYASNKNPLIMNGIIDFRNFDDININLNMNARNFELINAPKNKDASAYGKVNVDLMASLKGDMNYLQMRGQLNVLGTTDVTYVLKDSPLTVEDRLSDLVTFADFSDTTSVAKVEKPHPMNIDMVIMLNIDQATQVHCLLSPDRSHYIDLEGGGNLNMIYSPDGDLKLNGRYEVISGEMRYSLPIIPLKTFTIKSGSYVEFTGNIMNPRLNLAATERVRTTVTENNTPRSVNFDVGLSITQTLENMGLEFTLEAPEDMNIQNELSSMSIEQRGRLAVTMLATGMYLANNNKGSNKGSFSTSNALNAYLQSEIAKISGKALSTIDVSFGMENSTSASGGNQTDYSFQFAKRFWGNRISVIIGGKVSTGDDAENTGETLIDNVSIEYRLDNSATRYVKVFYDKSYESLLEGEITEMGAGLVLRKKMDKLGELFIFRKKKNKDLLPRIQKTEK